MIEVVHLASPSLGEAPTAAFLASYRERPAGVDHRLVIVTNGPRPDWLTRTLGGLAADVHEQPAPTMDLAAYRGCVQRSAADILCFFNSNAVMAADEWLAKLTLPLGDPRIGLTGATASFESRLPPWHRPNLSAQLSLARHYPRFPNPHVRTNGFAARRADLLALDWPDISVKAEAWRFESSRSGLTAQIRARGLQVVVVGGDGTAYSPNEWPRSGTFKQAGQENLLVKDNQTEAYATADAAERERLTRATWGVSRRALATSRASHAVRRRR